MGWLRSRWGVHSPNKSHWWEFFRQRQKDDRLIAILHEVADELANNREIKVISFNDLLADDSIV